MAGQGKVTIAVASAMESSGWSVAYTCIPNTPHIGAVAIPTKQGTSQQRYPDVVACSDNVLALVEVEISLNRGVAEDIIERFNEMCSALSDKGTYRMWSAAVAKQCGVELPTIFNPSCHLVLTRSWSASSIPYEERLNAEGIGVSSANEFSPKSLVA